jgi:ubiquitin carboxyl-terminal hydrolase 47
VEVEGRPTELTVGQRLRRGPYVYELFSIMIHSGSAIGGHYYAYIKSFADKKWYCFNDQSVSKLNEEDIEGTFGGPDSRSRGYYSSMYASSANAYMLMYRRIDRSKNNDFLPKEDLPLHVLDQIEEDRLLQEEKRRLEEYERSLCKFRLFARHPVSGELMEKKIEVQNQWSLEDTVTEAHKILELQDVVPVSRCRLVRYDEYSECLDQSFDENEGMEETFCMMVGGPRNYYSFELFLEIRAENEVFKQYNRGGLNLKILLVNLETLKVALPVAMRAEQSWTVLQLKEAVSEKFGLLVETMNLAVETYQNEGRHLAIDSHQLKHESLFKKHTIFACSDPEDFRKPFKESEMNKLIDVHVNSILLYVTIPPPPQRPAIATTTAETTEERDEEREGGVVMESSVDKPGEQPTADNEEGPPATSEGVGTGGSEISPPEAPPPTEDTVDMTKERPLQRTIEVRIDRRSTLQDLKDMLVEHVQQPVNNFKIYRLYSNNQEYEMSRLNDHLNTMPRETQLIVRLGRALQAGEVRVRLSLLRMEEAEFCKPLMDSIVTKGMTVGEFKKQLVREAYKQGIEYPLQIDRLRLRKKTWRTASTIYLDDQVFERDIHVFANFEIYVEPLKGLEPMTSPDQMQIYLKRWHPSTYTVDPPHEIILDQNSPAHLRMRISEASGIPQEHVMFGKAHNSFPGEVSVLDLDDDLEWNPKVSSISSMPLSIYDDGAVLYYKDGREKLMDLTAEKKNEILKNERLAASFLLLL